MRLATSIIAPGNLLAIRDAAPKSNDFSPQYVTVGKLKLPAFVDGKDLVVRCPKDIAEGSYPVTVNGAELGRIVVDAQ